MNKALTQPFPIKVSLPGAQANTYQGKIYRYTKKQGPSPISLVRATRIFFKAKTLKEIYLPLDFGDNLIYSF